MAEREEKKAKCQRPSNRQTNKKSRYQLSVREKERERKKRRNVDVGPHAGSQTTKNAQIRKRVGENV